MTIEIQFKNVEPGDVGIIGDPIEHSLSPVMQNAALKTWQAVLKKEGKRPPTYHKLHVRSEELPKAIELFKAARMRGLNVTIPHKVSALPFMGEVNAYAQSVGAINTIVLKTDKLLGFNTDGDGFAQVLTMDAGLDVSGREALVLGAGGTGRVIVCKLVQMGIKSVYWWNRDPMKVTEFIEKKGFSDNVQPVKSVPEVQTAIKKVNLAINATSVGLSNKDGLPVPNLDFQAEQVVFDVIYHRETEFLKKAKSAGAKTLNGVGMLVYQGAKSFELWMGAPGPVEIMRQAVEDHLKRGTE